MRASSSKTWLLLALCCIAACGREDGKYFGTTKPKHGPDEVWTNLGAEPEYIDPGKCSDASGGFLIFNLFAGLTQPDPVTLEARPDIAQSWEVSADGRRYTFHLRPTRWSDGRPLTAEDFAYAWRRVLDPKTESKYATFLYPLRYAEMFNRGALMVRNLDPVDKQALRTMIEAFVPIERVVEAPELGVTFVLLGGEEDKRAEMRAKLIGILDQHMLGSSPLNVAQADSSVVGVHAQDDLTLVAELEDPLPYFLDLVKFYTAMPVPRHVIEALENRGLSADLWTRPEYMVNNGPYLFVRWKFRQLMELEKNKRYWDAEHVKIKRIRLSMVESANTTLNLYEAGELDSIGNASLPAEFMDHLARYADFRRAPYLGTYFFWFNVKAKPMDDVRVRKALSLAIDRKSIVEHIARGGQVPSADMVPEGLGGYHGPASPIYDPDKARALLASAGYGPQHPLPKIVLTYNTSEGHKQMAEAIQQMWKHELGVDVELRNQEWKVYLKTLETGDFQIARMGWIGDYPDPYTFLELLSSSNGNNHGGFADPRYDALLRQGNATLDRQGRFAILEQAEALAMEQAPILPIYVYTRSELTKPYVKGHTLNYENRFLFKYWWIDRSYYDDKAAQP